MSAISVQEIQADPGEFLERVEDGESLLVVREERVILRVQPRKLGRLAPVLWVSAGEFVTPADFDEPLPEEILRELFSVSRTPAGPPHPQSSASQ